MGSDLTPGNPAAVRGLTPLVDWGEAVGMGEGAGAGHRAIDQ